MDVTHDQAACVASLKLVNSLHVGLNPRTWIGIAEVENAHSRATIRLGTDTLIANILVYILMYHLKHCV